MVKQIKETASNGLQFAKKLSYVITAFAMVGLGIYAVYQGRAKISLALGAVALIFAGVLAALVGFAILYKALMAKESREQ